MVRVKRDPSNPLVMKNFMAPATLLAGLQRVSEREGVSESEIIRRALERYMADTENGTTSSGTGRAAQQSGKKKQEDSK
jgi:metal-responsive CopG/Arc/MetJ family transcriptional regulator